MLTLPASQADAVLDWITRLPYPWTDAQRIVATAPAIEALAPVLQWIRRDAPHTLTA